MLDFPNPLRVWVNWRTLPPPEMMPWDPLMKEEEQLMMGWILVSYCEEAFLGSESCDSYANWQMDLPEEAMGWDVPM